MPRYRVVKVTDRPHENSEEMAGLNEVIEVAKKLAKEQPSEKFEVEKIERVWSSIDRKPASNAIHASIRSSDCDIGDD